MMSSPRFRAAARTAIRAALTLSMLGAVMVSAADRADPFATAPLRPSAPSQFWNGPASVCPATPQVPDPLHLSEAVDLALCNNPLTRETWAGAKAAAAALG